jgi:hypothetical protein
MMHGQKTIKIFLNVLKYSPHQNCLIQQLPTVIIHVFFLLCECTNPLFLGAFSPLQKATISFVMSVRPHGKNGLPQDGLSLNLILEDFPKSATKIQVPSISYKNNVSFFI